MVRRVKQPGAHINIVAVGEWLQGGGLGGESWTHTNTPWKTKGKVLYANKFILLTLYSFTFCNNWMFYFIPIFHLHVFVAVLILCLHRLDLLTFLSNQVSKTSIKKGFIFFKHFITLRGITQRSYTSHSLRFKNAVSQSRVVDFRRTQWYYFQCAAFLNRGMFDHSEIDVFVAPGSEVIESHLLLLGAQGLWEQNRTSQAERTKQLTPHFQLNSRV
jgi:hypothetical protein